MRSPWQALRALFARVGSDPYYASYERSLGNIKAEVDRLQVRAGWRKGCCQAAAVLSSGRGLALPGLGGYNLRPAGFF